MKKLVLLLGFFFSIYCSGQRYTKIQKVDNTYIPVNVDHSRAKMLMNEQLNREVDLTIRNRESKEEENKRTYESCVDKTLSVFSELTTFSPIPNGSYTVAVNFENRKSCGDRKVHVIDNRITVYLAPDGTERRVLFCSSIKSGKCYAKVLYPDNTESELFGIYFLEYYLNNQ